MTDVILFSEDVLLEQAALKIIAVENPRLRVSNVMGKRGFGYFQSRIDQIRRSASSLIFVAFLDGDELGIRVQVMRSITGLAQEAQITFMSGSHSTS